MDGDLLRFPDEANDKYNIILQKLKGLKTAIDEYLANTKCRVSDLKDGGAEEELRHFRPVTPANVRVLLRLVGKDIALLRDQYKTWRMGDSPDHIWAKQIDGKIEDLEKQLQARYDQLNGVKKKEDYKKNRRNRKSAKSAKKPKVNPDTDPNEPDEAHMAPSGASSLKVPDTLPQIKLNTPPLIHSPAGASSQSPKPRPPPKSCEDCDSCKQKPAPKPKRNIPNRFSRETSQVIKRASTRIPRRTMSDTMLIPPHRELGFTGGGVRNNFSLARQKTRVDSTPSRIPWHYSKQTNSRTPQQSSFPDLPPIWTLKRRDSTADQPGKDKTYYQVP